MLRRIGQNLANRGAANISVTAASKGRLNCRRKRFARLDRNSGASADVPEAAFGRRFEPGGNLRSNLRGHSA
jgi:hypothetical protein